MLQIRTSVFETNSSSTHSICISKNPVDAYGKSINFNLGYYGWEYDECCASDYFYTAILCAYGIEEREQKLKQLKDILDSYNVSYIFEEPKLDSWGNYDCYIDHSYETREFVEKVLSDEDMLMRLLFNNNSVVYTGNDNEEFDYAHCYIAEPYMWDYDIGKNIPNPYHDEEKFDYFLKSS